MSKMDDEYTKFAILLQETTANLKALRHIAEENKWQFGGTSYSPYKNFVEELTQTTEGWVASQC
jgi:hypothetical protein